MDTFIRYIKGIFRYKITSIFFIIGQLVMFFAVFGALGIYNKAYDKEMDRLAAIYEHRIQIDVTTMNKSDIFTDAGYNVTTGNLLLAGKLDLDIAEAGYNTITEVLLTVNEELPYKLIEGHIPGTEDSDKGKMLVALGRDKYKYAYEKDGKYWITIAGDVYEVCGVIGSEVSNYWDYKVVLNINCLGEETLKNIISRRNYTLELSSNKGDLQESYSFVYSNIMSLDSTSAISAKKLNSKGNSTMRNTFGRENLRVNIVVYVFCILNCMVMSEFWIIQRKKELAIRKTFGMSNLRIIFHIVQNIISLIITAFLIFIVIYGVARLIGWEIVGLIDVSFYTCVAIICVIIVSSAVTMMYPIYKIIKLNPAVSLSDID